MFTTRKQFLFWDLVAFSIFECFSSADIAGTIEIIRAEGTVHDVRLEKLIRILEKHNFNGL